ncbi:MAG: hypothetical protein LBQ09_00495, partial [Acidobacteriaceae bacterium]|nr:hypothetical protein [Acidobacteriaceae bacterium]
WLVAVTEGGYHLDALGASLLGVLDVLGEPAPPPAQWPASSVHSQRGRVAVDAVRRAHAGFWKLTG